LTWLDVFGDKVMFIVFVYVHVKEESIDAFRLASLENAEASRLEPGIVRFDVIQQEQEPARFILIEIYSSEDDPARHKETAHYLKWRETVAPMMAEPRRGVRYKILSPEEEAWG
jgi:quinol monooxygenase YgiN